MIRIRRGIAAIALLWLSAQCIAFTATAFVPALVASDAECTCGDNGGVMCPMHHRRPLGSAHCAMRSVPPPTPAIWLGAPGIPAMAILTIAPAPVRSMLLVFVATRFGVSSSPEPPPPRA